MSSVTMHNKFANLIRNWNVLFCSHVCVCVCSVNGLYNNHLAGSGICMHKMHYNFNIHTTDENSSLGMKKRHSKQCKRRNSVAINKWMNEWMKWTVNSSNNNNNHHNNLIYSIDRHPFVTQNTDSHCSDSYAVFVGRKLSIWDKLRFAIFFSVNEFLSFFKHNFNCVYHFSTNYTIPVNIFLLR